MSVTEDQKESEFFKILSSNWWTNPQMTLLQNYCKLLGPYISKTIQETFSNKSLSSLRVLEVGCGGGYLSELLSRAGYNLVAIDINEDLIEVAKSHAESDSSLPKINYLVDSIENHCRENYQQYDVVVSNFVLEHVADHDYFIKCCSDCIKPGGLLFMSALAKTFLCWLNLILISEYIVGVIPKGTHHYNKCIKASDTERIMRLPCGRILRMSLSVERSTIDKEEYELFKSVSSTWWTSPQLKVLHNICKLLGPYIIETIQKTYSDKPLGSLRILEVGCGGGFLSEILCRSGCNLVAIDINQDLINVAKTHAESDLNLPKINYLLDSIENHCKENYQQYDVVISNFVLEHVTDHDYFIKCCSDCIKPGGLLLMSALAKTFLCWLSLIVIAENITKCIPKGGHNYDKCINSSDTECIMKLHNLKIESTRGIFINPFNSSASFTSTTAMTYIVCAKRCLD
ncbi:hypothetical protein FQR65_LT06889 [Abscondita terminalis]|nr:hypothetical protein FQR65_LT06889 [Abscondita terminalis]